MSYEYRASLLSLALLLLGCSFPPLIAEDYSTFWGLTTSLGCSYSYEVEERIVVDFNYHFILINGSAEIDFNNEATDQWQSRRYLGLGPSWLEIQRGFGNDEASWRLRTILNLPGLAKYDKWETLWYPSKESGARHGPVLSLTVDYYPDYKRYGVLLGIPW